MHTLNRYLMKNFAIILVIIVSACTASNSELAHWETMAEDITITRDDWGIAHVHGPTDAHAVFGMIYAQAEDDFNRIEVNFLNSQGKRLDLPLKKMTLRHSDWLAKLLLKRF